MFKSVFCIWEESVWEEKLLYLYTIAIPFIDYFLFSFFGKKILYADFIFLFLFTIWVAKYLSGKIKINLIHLRFSLILLPVLFTVSLFNSSGILNSFAELLGLIYLIILFILVANVINSYKKLKIVLYLYFITSTILSLVGLGLLFKAVVLGDLSSNCFLSYGTMEAMAHHFPRIDLTFESANMALAYLHVALIFGALLFLTESIKKNKLLIILSSIVILAAAFFTGSRRFTGLLLSLFIIICWYGRGRIVSVVKYFLFLSFLLFLVVSIITSIWVVFPVKISKDDVTKNINLKATYSYSIHYLLPVVSFNMFKEHPLIGIGFGTFNKKFKDYVDWDWLESKFGFEAYPGYVNLVKEKKLNFDPHSVFFGALAETGLLGFAGLIYFIVSYAIVLIGKFKRSSYFSFDNFLTGCLIAGFIGFIFNALTLDILSMRHFWFMLAIGLVNLKKQ